MAKKAVWKERYQAMMKQRNDSWRDAQSLLETLHILWEKDDPGTRTIILGRIPNFQQRWTWVITNKMVEEWYAPQLKAQIERTNEWLKIGASEPSETLSSKSTKSDGGPQEQSVERTKDRLGKEC